MRNSLKLRLTLWYTAMMVLVIGGTLIIMSAFSGSLVASDDRRLLETQLSGFLADVEIEDDKVEIEGASVRNGVYFGVYSVGGTLLAGASAPEFPTTALKDNADFEVTNGALTFYVSDRRLVGEENRSVVVRAILKAQSSVSVASTLFRLALFALPFLVIVASLVGYLVAYRALKPMERLVAATEKVANSGDLSQRTGLTRRSDEVGRLTVSFDRMMERLESAFDRERRFTADASHELRTPTTVILSQVELAKAHPEDTEEQRIALDVIERQAKKMKDLTQTLLSLSRLDQSDELSNPQPVDLSLLIHDHLQDYGWTSVNPGRFTVKSAMVDPIPGDAQLIGQAFDNLIQNAIKFSSPHQPIDVELSQNAQQVTLSVTDHGIGMEASVRERIFDRFFQADSARSNQFGSQGLGLALTKRIIELHHGSINVESTPGLGTRMTIVFKK